MFTPQITDEELQDAAYKDYLEIRMKMQIAFEQFIHSLRFGGTRQSFIHSLILEKKY